MTCQNCSKKAKIFDLFETRENVWRTCFNYCSYKCFEKKTGIKLSRVDGGRALNIPTDKKTFLIEPINHESGIRFSGAEYNGYIDNPKDGEVTVLRV